MEIDGALEMVRETEYLNFHADTVRIRGQTLWAAGRRDEADEAFSTALEMFERKGNVASARATSD